MKRSLAVATLAGLALASAALAQGSDPPVYRASSMLSGNRGSPTAFEAGNDLM